MYPKRKLAVRLAIVATAALLLPFLLTPVASATTYTPTSFATCAATPGSVSWDSGTNTCTLGAGTLSSPDSIVVSSGITLVISDVYTVNSGASITVDSGGTLVIATSPGELDVYGTLTIDSGGMGTVNGLLVDHSTGVISVSGGLIIAVAYPTGEFYTAGMVLITGSGSFLTLSTGAELVIATSGSVDSDTGASVSIASTALAENYGILETTGTGLLTNYGRIFSHGSAAVYNYGTMTNAGNIYFLDSSFLSNIGTFNENLYVELDSFSTIDNYGVFTIGSYPDEVAVYDAAEFYNDGTVNVNGGELYDNANFYNDVSGTFTISGTSGYGELLLDSFSSSTNYGVIDNYGYVYNYGSISNYGFLDNYYVFYNYFDVTNYNFVNNELTTSFIGNEPGADFDNSAGTIDNSGALPFSGIFNSCHATFEVGTVFGNPVQFYPCAPLIKAPSSAATETPTISGDMNGWFSSGGGSPLTIDLYVGQGSTFLGSGLATSPLGAWSITSGVDLAAGPYTLYAKATDAQGYVSGYSSAFPFTVVLPTSTTVSCAPTPFPVGTSTTCTATVTELAAGSGTLIHTAPTMGTFLWGSSPVPGNFGACTLKTTGSPGVAQCVATFTSTNGPLSTPDTITFTYNGFPNYWGASSGTYGVETTILATTTSLTSASCGPLVANLPVSCVATISDSPTSTIAPGGSLSVTFSWTGTGSFSPVSGKCTPTGSGTSATCTVTFTPGLGGEGTFYMTATYAGDSLHTGSSSGSVALTVFKRSDSVAVSCTPNPEVVNAATTCTATVADTSGTGAITPTGTAAFSSSGAGLFSASFCALVSGSCSVTYTPSPGSEGTATITATYSGDTDHAGNSNTAALTVDKRSVSIVVSCPATGVPKKALTCTITVTDTSPGTVLTPTGKVTVHITGPKSATLTCTLAGSGGTAKCTVKYTPTKNGTYTVATSYPGDTNHLAISGSTTFKIT